MPWVKAHVAAQHRALERVRRCRAAAAAVYPSPSRRNARKPTTRACGAVEDELKAYPRTREERGAQQERLVASFGRFATTALGLEDDAVHMITHEFIPVGTELARWTRRFDPAMTKTEIVQACRNAWTACGLQPLLGRTTELTPSILAYSLMYPYSDNYIDRADIPAAAKSEFSARFRERLRGDGPPPLERTRGRAVDAGRYGRGGVSAPPLPAGLRSMLAIHAAQERSIAQLKNGGLATRACSRSVARRAAPPCWRMPSSRGAR